MELTEEDYKELIGYLGWLSAIKKFNNTPTYIDFEELKKYFLLQTKVLGEHQYNETDIKSMVNTLVRRKLIEFKKENDIVFLKLVL